MWIESLHIDGFGLFSGQTMDGLPEGLVVFLGDNESGKSTLMEFIRGILFGWPREGNTYPPLRGGRYGGRVAVVMRDGRRFTIERWERSVTVCEEGKAPERVEPCQRLFPGVNREVFRRVFAIGLKDMWGLEVLWREEIRGWLLSASGGLRPGALVDALRTLESGMGALLAPRARKEINVRLEQLRQLDAVLAELRGQSAEYARMSVARDEAERRVAEARAELDGITSRLRRIEQLEAAREPWVELEKVRERIAQLEPGRRFPPDGWQRLQALEQAMADLKAQLEEAEAEAGRWRERLASLRVDEAVLGQAAAIEALHGAADHLASARKDLPDVQAQLSAAERALEERLRELGPDWDIARLEGVDCSLQVRQRVREFAQELELARRRAEAAEADWRAAKGALSDTEREWEETRRALAGRCPPRIPDRERVERLRRSLASLRVRLHEMDMARLALQEKRERQADTMRLLDQLRQQREQGRPLSPRIPRAVAVVVVLVGAGLAAWGRYGLAAWVLGAGLLALVPIWLVMRAQARGLRVVRSQEEALGEDRERLAREVKELGSRLALLEADAARLASELGLAPPVGAEDVERAALDLEAAVAELAEWMEAKKAVSDAEGKRERARQRVTQAEDALREARTALETARARWQEWWSSLGFAPGLTPAGAEVLLGAVEAAREAKRTVDVQRERVNRMSDYLSQVRDRINSVLAACGRKERPDPGAEDIAELHGALQEAREAHRRRQEAADRLRELERRIGQLKGQIADHEAQRQALFSEAGARDRGEFCHLRDQSEELRERERQAEECDLRLRTIAGSAEAVQDLVDELRRTDAAGVAAEREELLARKERVQGDFETALREAEGAARRMDELATDRKLSDVLLQQKSLGEEIRQLVRQWAVYAMCRGLIDRARKVYEQERQPRVIKEAERLLGTMVPGRYSLLYCFEPEQVRLQETVTRVAKGENAWSRGLAEQVFLAVRLGVAREFAREAEPLPVVLDDVLVDFDPHRSLGAARVILEFARQQQVFLFTCHPDLVARVGRVAREMGADPALIPLYVVEDGRLRRGHWPVGTPG